MLTSASQVPATERRALLVDLESFRRSRITKAVGIEPTPRLPTLLFHDLPVDGLNDIRSLASLPEYLRKSDPFHGTIGWPRRYNADGYSQDNGDGNSRPLDQVQWFRFGGFEVYSANLVTHPSEHGQYRVPFLATELLADIVLRGTVEALGVLRSVVGVATPFALSAALIGMRDVHFATRHWAAHSEPIGSAEVLTPWVTTESTDSAEAAVRQVADVIWQSAGYPVAPSKTTDTK
jgi:hypothetical protein